MSDFEKNKEAISILENEILSLDPDSKDAKDKIRALKELKEKTYNNLTAWDRVLIARSPERLKTKTLIENLFEGFIELHGDRYFGDDHSIISGIGYLKDLPVTILAQAKGRNIKESIDRNFGMTSPEGYRKTLRLAKEAEKFGRPIITIVDTSGAYPGKGAEERGQAEAIARNLMEFSTIKTPIITIVLSEGGSGGALALSVCDYLYMFENAIYSVLSPEGFSTILFKNSKTPEECANLMELTSKDLYDKGICDEIIKEPLGGVKNPDKNYYDGLKDIFYNRIKELQKKEINTLLDDRYNKYRNIGE
jgi:acetyl-CoA carboxylase carboxyl transferase subunit alpha